MERNFNRGIIGPNQIDIQQCNQLTSDDAYLRHQKLIYRLTFGASTVIGIPTAASLALAGCSAPVQQQTAPSPGNSNSHIYTYYNSSTSHFYSRTPKNI